MSEQKLGGQLNRFSPEGRRMEKANDVTRHKSTLTFEIDLEVDKNEEESRRYRAGVSRLDRCQVYAHSETQALHKIGQAIDILWTTQTVKSETKQ